jgi:hypothetical protein
MEMAEKSPFVHAKEQEEDEAPFVQIYNFRDVGATVNSHCGTRHVFPFLIAHLTSHVG